MKIKDGVKIAGLQPQMVLAFIIASEVYKRYGVEVVLTEGSGSRHSLTSRHYIGFAIDIRTRDFHPVRIPVILAELKNALGDNFLVLFEENHFHISFKPRY